MAKRMQFNECAETSMRGSMKLLSKWRSRRGRRSNIYLARKSVALCGGRRKACLAGTASVGKHVIGTASVGKHVENKALRAW